MSTENPLFDAIVAGRALGDGHLLRDRAPGDAEGRDIDDERFFEAVMRISASLLAAGVEPGDRVAAQVAKSWQALALYVATVRSGAVFLPLNTAYTDVELDYFIGDAEPRAIVCDPGSAAAVAALDATRRVGSRVLTLDASGQGSLFAASSAYAGAPVARDTDDLAAILYTSGTTGRSKGAMLSQGNLLSNARTLIEAWCFTRDDVLVHALPIFHTHGLFVASHCCLLSGASMVFLPGFDLDAVLGSLPGATTMMGVPTFYTRLLDDPRFDRDASAHLRLFVSGSAPMLAATHAAFEARTGQRILERYGMTETNMNCSNPYAGERRAGTVGPPLPGVEVRVRETGGESLLATGEVGTLEVRGPNVFQGYWRMPEKTAEELREDGFFVTGDLATIDADGYVTIVGRDKDLVISGGYNVYPKEVEVELDAQPGVLESAVVGVPDADLGERVIAFVVPSTDGEPAQEQALLAALRTRLARYKCPRELYLIDALPRNTMGKVTKNALRDRAMVEKG